MLHVNRETILVWPRDHPLRRFSCASSLLFLMHLQQILQDLTLGDVLLQQVI